MSPTVVMDDRDLVSNTQTHGCAARKLSLGTVAVTFSDVMSVFHQIKCTVVGRDDGMHEEHVDPVVGCGEGACSWIESLAYVDDDIAERNYGTSRSSDEWFSRYPCREDDSAVVFLYNNRSRHSHTVHVSHVKML